MKIGKLEPWPIGIFIVYTSFALFLVFRAFISVDEGVDLVAPDYYEKGVAYQEQIDKRKRSQKLNEKIEVLLDSQKRELLIHIPRSFNSPFEGKLLFFRPSDSTLDFSLPIQIDRDGNQAIDLSPYKSGFWRVKIDWRMAGLNYYQEEAINIP